MKQRFPTLSTPESTGKADFPHDLDEGALQRRASHIATRGRRSLDGEHRTGKGVNPSYEASAHRSNSAKHDLGCGRAVGHPVQGHPHRNPVGRGADARCTRWLAPDACEQSRNRSHNSKMPWHARASLQMEPRAHGRRTSRNTGPRAAARPEPLAVPSTLGAPETGRALRGSPPVASRLPARELERFATKWPAQTHGRAHAAGLQQGSIPARVALQQRHPL